MNYDLFTSAFPTLEGENIRLRQIKQDDLITLHNILHEPAIVKEYLLGNNSITIDKIQNHYLFNSKNDYQKKQRITWIIELKSNNKAIGLRELFVDNIERPLTVEGCMSSNYQRRGFSKEAYTLILDFARKHKAIGLRANTSIENFAALALLYSVGFISKYVTFNHHDDLRVVVEHDLNTNTRRKITIPAVKRLAIFCIMHLQGEKSNITTIGSTRRNGSMHPVYKVQVMAKNTINRNPNNFSVEKIVFTSDGISLSAMGDPDTITQIDGSTLYLNAWGYCWQECTI